MSTKGRPTIYSDELAVRICSEVAKGKSLKRTLEADGMPGMTAVYAWLASNDHFAKLYARAKEDSADAMVDEMLDIADNADIDANSRRVMVDARKWIAMKLKPRRYGDRLETISTSTVTVKPSEDMSAEEASRAYRALVQSAPPVKLNS